MKIPCIFFAFLFYTFTLSAQVGINTETPNATLDIQASDPSSPENNEGLLIPRLDNFPAIKPIDELQKRVETLIHKKQTDDE